MVFLCWMGARAYALWPRRTEIDHTIEDVVAMPAFRPVTAVSQPFQPMTFRPRTRPQLHYHRMDGSSGIDPAHHGFLQLGATDTISTARTPRRAAFAYIPSQANAGSPAGSPSAAPLFPPQRVRELPIEAQAYLFWRPGGGPTPLAHGGELGGNQFAARIAVPVTRRLSMAARFYAPLNHEGAEGAVGVDLRPFQSQPIRISVERRQRLDALGRSAWSAYAAGGFWRGGGRGRPAIDGYAQAGVVGTQRRDLFIDGALRIGYQLPAKGRAITLGAGLWGAAQPQVSRLDAGPRIAVVVPVDHHVLTFALESRFRVAGDAAPGSGTALTIAADF